MLATVRSISTRRSFFFFFNDTATTEIYTLSYTTLFRSTTSWTERDVPSQKGRVAVITGDAALLRSEEHTSELQSRLHLVCRLLLEKKKTTHKVLRVSTQLQHTTTTTSQFIPVAVATFVT